MNCPQCSGELGDHTVCPHCGAPVVTNANADAVANPYAVGAQVQPETVVVRDPDAPEVPGFFRSLVICFWEKYFSFEGRASRSEFWIFFLMILAVELGFMLLAAGYMEDYSKYVHIGVGIFRLFVFWPLLDATIRRYHDVGLQAGVFFTIYLAAVGLIAIGVFLDAYRFNMREYIITMLIFLVSVNGGFLYGEAAVRAVEELCRYYHSDFPVPVLGIVAAGLILANLGVLLRPGKRGPNKYGPAPWKRPKERRETQ